MCSFATSEYSCPRSKCTLLRAASFEGHPNASIMVQSAPQIYDFPSKEKEGQLHAMVFMESFTNWRRLFRPKQPYLMQPRGGKSLDLVLSHTNPGIGVSWKELGYASFFPSYRESPTSDCFLHVRYISFPMEAFRMPALPFEMKTKAAAVFVRNCGIRHRNRVLEALNTSVGVPLHSFATCYHTIKLDSLVGGVGECLYNDT